MCTLYMFPADICYSPVYVYPHSKAVLMRANQEDTQLGGCVCYRDQLLCSCECVKLNMERECVYVCVRVHFSVFMIQVCTK